MSIPEATRAEIKRVQYQLSSALEMSTSPSASGQKRLHAAFEAVRSFDLFADMLYELRQQTKPDDRLRQSCEDFLASISHNIINLQFRYSEAHQLRWVDKYRLVWRQELSLFIFSFNLFIASCIVGWVLALQKPEYVPLIIPQGVLESVLEKKAWFASIQKDAFMYGVFIAWNNIKVCITAFTLGMLLGIGGLWILCFNGLMFGAIVGYCYINGFHEQLLQFVIGHGFLELSIIIASAFASLLYGKAFFTRPFSQFKERLKFGTVQAFTVLLGITPWLILAASIEVFVSPWDYLPMQGKIVLGIIAAALFWVWTFFPPRTLTPA